MPDNTDENADREAAQRRWMNTRVFQRLPGQLQHEPLLGVHLYGLTRGNREKWRVEAVNLFEEGPRKRLLIP